MSLEVVIRNDILYRQEEEEEERLWGSLDRFSRTCRLALLLPCFLQCNGLLFKRHSAEAGLVWFGSALSVCLSSVTFIS